MRNGRKFVLIAVLALLLLLAACAQPDAAAGSLGSNDRRAADGGETRDDEPRDAGRTRGNWDGNVFTSEYLGLRFVLPTRWNISTDADIAELMGVTADLFAGLDSEIPDNIEVFYDMMVINPFSGENIQLFYEMYGGRRTPSNDQIISAAIEGIEAIGGRASAVPGTARIGNYDWFSIRTEIEVFGTTMHGRQFINAHRGVIRYIVLTSSNPNSELFDNIPAMFTGLSGALPEPVSAQRASELTGTWEWDEDEEYTYEFLENGSGIRGFTGLTEQFEWYADGSGMLIFAFPSVANPQAVELWEYIIRGDVLTLSSLQVFGVEYSYIRR